MAELDLLISERTKEMYMVEYDLKITGNIADFVVLITTENGELKDASLENVGMKLTFSIVNSVGSEKGLELVS